MLNAVNATLLIDNIMTYRILNIMTVNLDCLQVINNDLNFD